MKTCIQHHTHQKTTILSPSLHTINQHQQQPSCQPTNSTSLSSPKSINLTITTTLTCTPSTADTDLYQQNPKPESSTKIIKPNQTKRRDVICLQLIISATKRNY
ncbi:hypothetical protein KC19_11G103200 [Ceratodon purpureus]|uniref:Uncharacterized protein n=1 Tax=Ceratodon purpureus TaxID=3225 RepID=A0A8T0GCJ9_CERPU|nr:hypothetical protein KC19_11G103200 [Ceratodon purpureus]